MGYFPFDNYPSQVGDDIWLVLMDHQPQIPWDRGKPWAHPDGNDSWMVSMNPKIQKKECDDWSWSHQVRHKKIFEPQVNPIAPCCFSASSPSCLAERCQNWITGLSLKQQKSRLGDWQIFVCLIFNGPQIMEKENLYLPMSVSQIHWEERSNPMDHGWRFTADKSIWISDSYLQTSIGGTTNNNVGCYASEYQPPK